MKVRITIEVDDETRRYIAESFGRKGKLATREECQMEFMAVCTAHMEDLGPGSASK